MADYDYQGFEPGMILEAKHLIAMEDAIVKALAGVKLVTFDLVSLGLPNLDAETGEPVSLEMDTTEIRSVLSENMVCFVVNVEYGEIVLENLHIVLPPRSTTGVFGVGKDVLHINFTLNETNLAATAVLPETLDVTGLATEEYVQQYVADHLPGGESETVILAEQSYTSTLDSTYGYFNTATPTAALVIGETYRVVMDGAEYRCIGEDGSAFAAGSVVFGNLTDFGGSGNGEPFVAQYNPQYNVVSIMYLEDTAPTTHTVAIYQVSEDALATESFVKTYVEQYVAAQLAGITDVSEVGM